MACSSCGQKSSGCGCESNCNPLGSNWLITVDRKPPVEMARKRYAYITPDNKVWVLSHDGTEMIDITKDEMSIEDATEALPLPEEADMLKLYRQGDKLVMIKSDRSDWIVIN